MKKLTMKTNGSTTIGQCNVFRRFLSITLAAVAMFWAGSNSVWAQCSDVTVSGVPTPSTCQANGTIQVTLSGANAGNIDMSTEQYALKNEATGTYSLNFTHTTGGLLTGIAPGTYTLEVRGFCSEDKAWHIYTGATSVVVGGSYQVPIVGMPIPRKSLNCRATGSLSMSITNGTKPYKVEIIDKPGAYAGQTSFTGITASSFTVGSLPPGTYTLKTTDACDYGINRTVVVGALDSDIPVTTVVYGGRNYALPLNHTHPQANDCHTIGIHRELPASGTDEFYYYVINAATYYEFGVSENIPAMPTTWDELTNHNQLYYTMSQPYNNMYGKKLYLYVRVKGCATTKGPEMLDIHTPTQSTSVEDWANVGGCGVQLRFKQGGMEKSVICYPYTWTIKPELSATVVSSGTATDNVGYQYSSTLTSGVSYMLTCTDALGTKWDKVFSFTANTNQDFSTLIEANSPCTYNAGVSDEIAVRENSNTALIPGTIIEMIACPAGVPADIRQPYTVPVGNLSSRYYPFRENPTPDNDFVPNPRKMVTPPGSYTFKITNPCTGMTTTVANGIYEYTSSLTYTTQRVCGGLQVNPTGTVTRSKYGPTYVYPAAYVYFRISNGRNKSGIIPIETYDRTYVPTGTPLILPTPGTYTIAIGNSRSTSTPEAPSCDNKEITVVYEDKGMSLADHSGYVCVGESAPGHIRITAANGVSPYTYELMGTGLSNSTGVFSYGNAGETYTIKVTDNCPSANQSTFYQDIKILDLNTATILIAPKTSLCEGDTIAINCLSLGNTTYQWTLPNSSTRNTQNLLIPNATVADSGPYTVSVKPEFCPNPLVKSININVKNCNSFAVDDYVAIWECESTTIDVLANDIFEGTVGISAGTATYGTVTPSGNKLVYTHNCTDGAGQTDVIPYEICSVDNIVCPAANIYVTIMKKPAIHLLDSCSTEPKLQLDLQYAGATYQWQYSDNGSTWTNITGGTGTSILATEAGYYQVQVTYNGKTITTAVGHLQVLRTVRLPGGAIWYAVTLD